VPIDERGWGFLQKAMGKKEESDPTRSWAHLQMRKGKKRRKRCKIGLTMCQKSVGAWKKGEGGLRKRRFFRRGENKIGGLRRGC